MRDYYKVDGQAEKDIRILEEELRSTGKNSNHHQRKEREVYIKSPLKGPKSFSGVTEDRCPKTSENTHTRPMGRKAGTICKSDRKNTKIVFEMWPHGTQGTNKGL